MFDCHLHSTVSHDGKSSPRQIAEAARCRGLQEICFTDHLDYCGPEYPDERYTFSQESYSRAYDGLEIPGLKICRGVELGMTHWDLEKLQKQMSLRRYDFVIGSVHVLDNMSLYMPAFWEGKTVEQVERQYFEEILTCIRLYDDFDVLGHLTYVTKTGGNPSHRRIPLEAYRDIVTEIMKVLIEKGKGIEVNTSGLDQYGDYLPGEPYLRLFRDLGGRIVTVGSDAHTAENVGKHCDRACRLVQDIFGYVCTFEGRKPVYHKL